MQALLEGLLPRLFPNLSFHCIPHEGKDDLDGNIRTTLRDWRVPDDRFIILRDNDNADCTALKKRLQQRCRDGRREDTLVRLTCQELEAWYLGEPDAMADAFDNDGLRSIKNRPIYRNPDACPKPSSDIERLVPEFRKIPGARAMAQHLTREGNRSHSFAVFLNGVENLLRQL